MTFTPEQIEGVFCLTVLLRRRLLLFMKLSARRTLELEKPISTDDIPYFQRY